MDFKWLVWRGLDVRLELGSPKVAMLLSGAEIEKFLSMLLLIQKESGRSFLREAFRSDLKRISKENSSFDWPGLNLWHQKCHNSIQANRMKIFSLKCILGTTSNTVP